MKQNHSKIKTQITRVPRQTKTTPSDRERWRQEYEELERDEIPYLFPVHPPSPPVEIKLSTSK